MASKNFSLQKLTHPSPSGGGSSNGLDYREILAKPAEPRLPHSSRQKLEAEMMKPQILRRNCGFRRRIYTRVQSRPRVMARTWGKSIAGEVATVPSFNSPVIALMIET